jgi:hypothetical protein
MPKSPLLVAVAHLLGAFIIATPAGGRYVALLFLDSPPTAITDSQSRNFASY